MKLSLKKKWGHIHVRGGRLLKVLHRHAVDAKGHCVVARRMKAGQEPPPRTFPGDLAFAVPGDLAIEIVNVANGNLVGYSYLSGDAIQLNGYGLPRPDRFEDARLEPAVLPDNSVIPEGADATSVTKAFYHAMVAMKFSRDVDVFAFEGKAADLEGAQFIGGMIMDGFGAVPSDWTPEKEESERNAARSHVLGIIQCGKKQFLFLHLQPPRHTSDYAATPFQAGLCLSSLSHSHGGRAAVAEVVEAS